MLINHSFTNSLDTILDRIYSLIGDSDGHLKTGIDDEFLPTLLDMLHVPFFPHPPFSFALNQNACFLLSGLPQSEESLDLHWTQVIGDEHEIFESVYQNKLLPKCLERGFDLSTCNSIYYVVSRGENPIEERLEIKVFDITESGFSVDEVVSLFKATVHGEPESFRKQSFAGFLVEPQMQNRYRVSVWALSSLASVKQH